MITRRHFAAVCGVALVSQRFALAQQPARIAKVGWLGNSPHVTPEAIAIWDAFRLELQRLGWVEGCDVAIAAGGSADAWFVTDEAMHFAQRKTIVELIAMQRKTAIYPQSVFVAAGGLLSYAVDLKDQYRGGVDVGGMNPACAARFCIRTVPRVAFCGRGTSNMALNRTAMKRFLFAIGTERAAG